MRILVVEDEEKVASFIRKGLEQMSYTVEVAGTGEEALGLALATRYDALVLDVMLPGRDGLSVVRELRSRGSDVPVLALTARGTLEDRIAAWSVAAAREAAWTNGEVLWVLRGSPLLLARFQSTLDGITALASKTLLVPVPLERGRMEN